jgi:hypothetical protein
LRDVILVPVADVTDLQRRAAAMTEHARRWNNRTTALIEFARNIYPEYPFGRDTLHAEDAVTLGGFLPNLEAAEAEALMFGLIGLAADEAQALQIAADDGTAEARQVAVEVGEVLRRAAVELWKLDARTETAGP